MLFLLMVALGAGLGLLYGWVINPVKYVDSTPNNLRVDYQSDYVLMVAEAYNADGDLALAVRRLAILGEKPPLEIVREALIFGSQAPYPEADMQLLTQLASDLQTWDPQLGAPRP
jgi:hypothetical protein